MTKCPFELEWTTNPDGNLYAITPEGFEFVVTENECRVRLPNGNSFITSARGGVAADKAYCEQHYEAKRC